MKRNNNGSGYSAKNANDLRQQNKFVCERREMIIVILFSNTSLSGQYLLITSIKVSSCKKIRERFIFNFHNV